MELKGKFGTAKVFTDLVEPDAVSQIIAILNHPLVKDGDVRVMPDVHPGKGCTIGLTAHVRSGLIVPNMVGSDIACGVRTTLFRADNLDFKALDEFITANVPNGAAVHNSKHSNAKRYASTFANVQELCSRYSFRKPERIIASLGTLGGGNHYVEIGRVDEDVLALSVHSGSRMLGQVVCDHFQNLATVDNSVGAVSADSGYLEGKLRDDYLAAVHVATEFALVNRSLISDDILKFVRAHVLDSFDTMHNYVEALPNGDVVVRKGAVRANAGERLAIPLNMADGVILGTGRGNADWNNSAPHGAGRLLSRHDAKAAISLEEFQRAMTGVQSWSVGSSTIDESPLAYKPAAAILDVIGDTVDVKTVVKPLYNFKSR